METQTVNNCNETILLRCVKPKSKTPKDAWTLVHEPLVANAERGDWKR